jgi:hypothetical protein
MENKHLWTGYRNTPTARIRIEREFIWMVEDGSKVGYQCMKYWHWNGTFSVLIAEVINPFVHLADYPEEVPNDLDA